MTGVIVVVPDAFKRGKDPLSQNANILVTMKTGGMRACPFILNNGWGKERGAN